MANTDEWKAWLDEHGAALLLFARQHVRSMADAEDVLQEAFVRFWRSRHRARDPLAYGLMNPEFDDLESELRSLRPRQPFGRVRRGIADQLAQEPVRTASVKARTWQIALAALVVAASVAVIVFLSRQPVKQPDIAPGPSVVVETTDTVPPSTWLAYRQVLGRSDESLDDLLDYHGASLLTSGQQSLDSGSLYQELLPN